MPRRLCPVYARRLCPPNAKVRLLKGSSFFQFSLSDYFRSLYCLHHGLPAADVRREAIFFPIRRFNDSSLILPSGASVIEKLCSLGNLLLVEDVDLHADVLRRHLASHELTVLAASDATDRRRMYSSSLLCLCEKKNGLFLPGKRIW